MFESAIVGLATMLSPSAPEAGIIWAPSTFSSKRQSGAVVDTIVLHHTEIDTAKGVIAWFNNPNAKVSSHFTVDRDGTIYQHVSCFRNAWHAGSSVDWYGRRNVNRFSIGIEMVNKGDGKDPWPDAQIRAIHNLAAFLVHHRFPTITQITSHEFIAVPLGRKNDPKGFPWARLSDLGLKIAIKHEASLSDTVQMPK